MTDPLQARAKKLQESLSAAFAGLEPIFERHRKDSMSIAASFKSFESIWPGKLEFPFLSSMKTLEGQGLWPDHTHFDQILKPFSVTNLEHLFATANMSAKAFQQINDVFAAFPKTSLSLIDTQAIDKSLDYLRKDSINKILPEVSGIAEIASGIDFESLLLPKQAEKIRTSIQEIRESLLVASEQSAQSLGNNNEDCSRTSFFSRINKFLYDWNHLITALGTLIAFITIFNPPGTTIVFQPVITLNTVFNREMKIFCNNNQIFSVVVKTSVKGSKGKGKRTRNKITPGTLVQIVKFSGKWCQIAYIDSAFNELLGWCLKKNLEK